MKFPHDRAAAVPADSARPRVLLVPAGQPRERWSLMTLPFADWLPQQRWYAGRGRTIAEVTPFAITRSTEDLDHVLLPSRTTTAAATPTRWSSPGIGRRPTSSSAWRASARPTGGPATTRSTASGPPAICSAWSIAGREVDRLRVRSGAGRRRSPTRRTARVLDAEQSNTSVVFDTSAILKLFRRVVPGINPDLELNRALGAGRQSARRARCSARSRARPRRRRAARRSATRDRVRVATPPTAGRWRSTSARDLIADPDLRPDRGRRRLRGRGAPAR